MPKYVCTVKMGSNGAAITVRDTDTGNVIGFTVAGPRELVESFVKGLFSPPLCELKWE